MSTISGSCNCGEINVKVPQDVPHALCHCTNCRKQSGATASGNLVVDLDKFELSGTPKQWAYTGSSGKEAIRNFCGTCGSALYTQTHDKSPVFVKTGLFPPGSVPAVSLELFCKNLESWEKVHEGAQRVEEQ